MMAIEDSDRRKKQRPNNREVEHENMREPDRQGEPPRPSTEPKGAKDTSRSKELRNDPGSGEPLR